MPDEPKFSDYIVYVDESGHAASTPDPNYPCFVLAFCLFEKSYYRYRLAPLLQGLKFQFFGHDMVIIHEREVRKSLDEFAILKNKSVRELFMAGLNHIVEQAELSIISHVISKDGKHHPADNLYHMAAQHCLEELYEQLAKLTQEDRTTHIVFEMRGKIEDAQLELEVRRICAGQNKHRMSYPFVPVFASKKSNSSGLQFADLVARPIGNHHLHPGQPNRAYAILSRKHLQPHTLWISGKKQRATGISRDHFAG